MNFTLKEEMLQLEHDVTYNTNSSIWKGFKEGRLKIDDKGLILVSYKINPMWFSVSVQFGLIGGLIYEWFANRKRKQMQELFAQQDLRSVASNDKDSVIVEFGQIESFEVTQGFWQGNGITLSVGGKTVSMQFKKNVKEEVAGILRAKCGGREKIKE